MAGLRTPFFVLAALSMLLAVAFELSTLAFLRNAAVGGESAPGLGGPYLALLDGMLLYSMFSSAVGHFPHKEVTSRILAVVSLILFFFGVFGSFCLILLAFSAILLMLGLLFAAPFGTVAYFAAFAHFPKPDAVAALSFLMVLKLFFLVMLFLADPGYLKSKGLVLLIAVSLLATWLTSFLIAFPPGFLASITDAVGALITAVIAFVWMIAAFIAAIIAIIKVFALRSAGREV